jgi:hypothetical protein
MGRRKPIVRQLDGVSRLEAKSSLARQGFLEHDEGDEYAVLKKPGTNLTTRAHQFPLEATIEQKDASVELKLCYDSFVLFDTGDLQTEAERIARMLEGRSKA